MMKLLNMYYETDKAMTEEVLNQKIPMWKGQSLVEVAGDIGMKPFIETPACQLVLAKAWKGEVGTHYHFASRAAFRCLGVC